MACERQGGPLVVKPIMCLQYIKEKDKGVIIEWQKINYFWQLCKEK